MTTNMDNTRISITPLFINYTPNTHPYSHYNNNTNINNNNTQSNTNKQITIMLKQKRITISTNY